MNVATRRLLEEQIAVVVVLESGKKDDAMWHVPQSYLMTQAANACVFYYILHVFFYFMKKGVFFSSEFSSTTLKFILIKFIESLLSVNKFFPFFLHITKRKKVCIALHFPSL